MLRTDWQLFSDPEFGSDLSRRMAGLMLLDCKRSDWEETDLARMLERVYHSEGPAVATEIWKILKTLVVRHAREQGRSEGA